MTDKFSTEEKQHIAALTSATLIIIATFPDTERDAQLRVLPAVYAERLKEIRAFDAKAEQREVAERMEKIGLIPAGARA